MRLALFPGQGVHAGDVLDALSPGHEMLDEASEVLGYDLHRKVAPYATRKGATLPTWLAQPAIYVGGVLAHLEAVRNGTDFVYYAGHSVGEYTALTAAGAISFRDGLKLLDVRGRTMHQAAQTQTGAMVAVLSLPDGDVNAVAEASGVSIANDNAPDQVVLAGDDAAIGVASQMACDRGGRAILLGVAGAFHTEAMAPVRLPLKDALFSIRVRTPVRPVISNVTARPYRSPGEIRTLLVEQVTSKVRFRGSLEWAFAQGVTEFEDLGPGRVAAGLAQRTFNRMKGAVGV